MDVQRWQRVGAVFDAVADVPAGERDECLARLCGGDAALRAEVERLLAGDARAEHFDRGVESARGSAAAEWLEAADAAPAERVGPWRLRHELGRGGMGIVYLAERADGQFEQRAALKLIKRGMDSEAVLARFLRERQILARLEHPRIARLLDGGIAIDGRPYFAMEYVDGAPLLQHCAERRAGLRERIGLFLDVCAAVQFAHGRLVVHRDIKPSNILVTAAGEPKLLDFGIAKLLDESAPGATRTDAALQRPFTPAYAAPEQLRGDPVTTATDIFALGCVLYELLTGRRPHASDDAAEEQMLRSRVTGDPAAPSKVADPSLPFAGKQLRGDLDTIVLKALQHEPLRRYATVDAMAEDARRWLAGRPIQARRDHAGYRFGKFVRRHRVATGATILGAIALIGLLAFAQWQAREKAHEAQVAEQVTQFLTGIFRSADPTIARGSVVTAQEIVDQAAARLRADASLAPIVRARLLATIASTYAALGLYDRALFPAQQALALRRADSAASAVDIAAALDELGRVYFFQADYAHAQPLLDEALARRLAALPADDPAVIESRDHVAALARARGDFGSADAAFAAALHSAERRFGTQSPDTARYLEDYAANLDDMGKRIAALAIYRRVVAIRENASEPDDAETATALVNLGTHLDDSGEYAEAVGTLERATAMRRKIFGPDHPLVGIALVALAGVYESQDRSADCERTAQDALAILRKTLPQDHPKTTEALNLLAIVHMMRRDYTGAVAPAREVLARFERTLGDDHPNTLSAKNNLAYALSHSGQLAEAERLQREALAQVRGDNGQSVLATDLQNLATTLELEGHGGEAVALAAQALAIRQKSEGEVSGNAAVALRSLAAAEEMAGDMRSAERDLRAALAIGEQLQRTQHIDTYQWRLALADFLVGAGRRDEAARALDEVVAELEPRRPLRDPVPWLQARLLRGECLIAAGHAAEGRAMQGEARAGLRTLAAIDIDLWPTARKLLHAAGATKAPSR